MKLAANVNSLGFTSGSNLYPTGFSWIDDRVLRIRKRMAWGIQNIYFFIHQVDETFTRNLVPAQIEKFNENCR